METKGKRKAEDEIKIQGVENKLEKKGKPEPQRFETILIDLDARRKIEVIPGKPLILGRGKLLRIKDKRVDLNQVKITRQQECDDFVIVSLTGINPSSLKREGSEQRMLMKKGKEYALYEGDELALLVTLYKLKLKIKPKIPANEGKNYLFYSNKIASVPDGDLIDIIHEHWFGDYTKLEVHHGYIQWLFPIFEGKGMNFHSKRLRKEEAKLMREDLNIAKRVLKSYRLMLDFYGLELLDIQQGTIGRAPHWKGRYNNLNERGHNYLRITRILTSLGQLGFSRWKKPLVDFLEKEVKGGLLNNCKNALETFWKLCLKEDTLSYKVKTLEEPEDRTESVFFKDMK